MSKRKSEGSPSASEGRKIPRKGPATDNPNQEFVAALNQLSEYEKNVSGNVFKARAYKKAAHTVGFLPIQVNFVVIF